MSHSDFKEVSMHNNAILNEMLKALSSLILQHRKLYVRIGVVYYEIAFYRHIGAKELIFHQICRSINSDTFLTQRFVKLVYE